MTPFSAFLARWPLGVWHHRSGGLLRMVPLARLHMSPSGPLQLERFRLYPAFDHKGNDMTPFLADFID